MAEQEGTVGRGKDGERRHCACQGLLQQEGCMGGHGDEEDFPVEAYHVQTRICERGEGGSLVLCQEHPRACGHPVQTMGDQGRRQHLCHRQ